MESCIFSAVMLFHLAATALLAARPTALASAREQQTALVVAAKRALHFLLGSVVTWGDGDVGGDSSAVASQLRKGVRHICASYGAFAAVKAGSVSLRGYSAERSLAVRTCPVAGRWICGDMGSSRFRWPVLRGLRAHQGRSGPVPRQLK